MLVLATVATLGAACTVDTTGGGSDSPDAIAPTGTATVDAGNDALPPTDSSTGDTARADAERDGSLVNPDAGAEADSADATADVTTDATTDTGPADAAVDAGELPGPVLPGADGVLRGTVSGFREHSWTGALRLPSAACPAGARTVSQGLLSCCLWTGRFTNVSSAPVTFNLATATGTLAGAPIGPLGAPFVEADGTMRFRQPTILHAEKVWDASIAISSRLGAPAADLAGAAQLFRPTPLVRPVSDSLRNLQVTWNPTTRAFRITLDLTAYQNTPAGECPIPPSSSTGRVAFDLR